MESEKVKEIKKALKCCIKLNNTRYSDRERQLACISCPYAKKDDCDVIVSKTCLTLINELEKENEILEFEQRITNVVLIKENQIIAVENFVEKLKEKLKEKVNADNVDVFLECAKLSDETLKEFI